MPDEVAADDSGVPRTIEEILLRLFAAMREADRILETDPRGAVNCAAAAAFEFILHADCHMRGGLPPYGPVPGNALSHLVSALGDLDKGIVDPSLAPAKPDTKRGRHELLQNDQLARVKPVVVMELLYMADFRVEKAAKAVVQILKDLEHPIMAKVKDWQTIKRWRTAIKNAPRKSMATELFFTLVAEAKCQVEARGRTAADYEWLARGMLQWKEN